MSGYVGLVPDGICVVCFMEPCECPNGKTTEAMRGARPMTPTPDAVAALANVRERHRARTNDPTTTSITVCDEDEQLWPCDISVIVAALVPAATPTGEQVSAQASGPDGRPPARELASSPTSEREAEIRRLHAPHPPMDDQQLRCDGCDLLAILKTCRAERDVARTERAYWKDAHSGERDAAKVARAERTARLAAEAALLDENPCCFSLHEFEQVCPRTGSTFMPSPAAEGGE